MFPKFINFGFIKVQLGNGNVQFKKRVLEAT